MTTKAAGYTRITALTDEALALNIEGSSSANGAHVVLGGASHEWQPIWERGDLYYLLVRHSDQCLDVRVVVGTAPTELPKRDGTKMDMEPVDRGEVVDGVLTRATADGKTVVAQVGEEHWVEVSTMAGDTSLLRSVAAATVATQ